MSAYTVSVINKRIAETISYDPLLSDISVIGEISNLNYHYSGHVYFTLKDANSQIKCILFKSYANNVDFLLEEGMEIIVNGYISVYEKGGSYSLNAKDIKLANRKGDLAIKFQELKDKLEKEGLFDISHKKDIPFFPKKVGIVTSNTGAAVEDIKRIILDKNNYVSLSIFPTKVQGDLAEIDIANKINYINENFSDIDVLIVGRGGGSIEDLWAFNEEIVARAIFDSKIPIITSIGHEIDFTISDFVADKSAPTPTAAANMAVPNTEELRSTIEMYKKDLISNLKNKVSYYNLLIESYKDTIYSSIINLINRYNNILEKCKNSLLDNNPNNILSKGYSILKDDKNNIIKSKKDIKNNKIYKLTLKDGDISFKVEEISE